MTPKQLVQYFGGQSKTARQLGVSTAAISQWVSRGKVPMLRQYEICSRWPEAGLKVSRRVKR